MPQISSEVDLWFLRSCDPNDIGVRFQNPGEFNYSMEYPLNSEPVAKQFDFSQVYLSNENLDYTGKIQDFEFDFFEKDGK